MREEPAEPQELEEVSLPFGNPDGSRSRIENLLRDFVSFDQADFDKGVGMSEGDISWRVVAGAKGSGKTVYLRRMRAAANRNDSIYVDDIQNDLPPTELVIKFSHCYPRATLTERWNRAWTCSIYRSLATHMLYSPHLRDHISPEHKEFLATFVPKARTRMSVYSQLVEVLQKFGTSHRYSSYLDDSQWSELETVLADVLRELPPIYFFLDSVDERYENAPMYWLECQKGLFYAAMTFLRDSRLGSRLHVCIAIRDHVLSSVLQSEHAGRYRGVPHIRALRWTESMLDRFLNEKIRRLPRRYLLGPVNDDVPDVVHWLGCKEIRDHRRRLVNLKSYLLSHTRLLPRDVVQLGNQICASVRCGTGAADDLIRQVKAVVHDEARFFGEEQLRICANQIVTSGIPLDAARNRYLDAYIGNTDYEFGEQDKLKQLLRSVGAEVFDKRQMEVVRERSKTLFEGRSDVLSVLWQNGVVGFREKLGNRKVDVYFGHGSSEFLIPLDKLEYVFHPIVVSTIGLRKGRAHPQIRSAGADLMEEEA